MNQKAKEYILNWLNDLYARFEGVKVRYEFSEDLNVHLVEVLPLTLYENSQDYMLAEMKMEEEFQTLFEEEEILFVSEDSLNQIEEASFKLGYEKEDIFSFYFDLVDMFEPENQFRQELNVIDYQSDYALAA